MKTLYSSTFISIILAFLMFIGYNNQKVDIIEKPSMPIFSNVIEQKSETEYKTVKVEIFDNLICNGCSDFVLNTLPKIKNLEQETKNISLSFYFIPDINNEIYYMAAMSLKCSFDQNQYWGMLAKLHENKDSLNKKSFYKFAKELELNAEALNQCINEEVYKKSIEEDIKYASDKNIIFKPTIIINENYLIGDQPFENIQKVINESLKKIATAESEKSVKTDISPPASGLIIPNVGNETTIE